MICGVILAQDIPALTSRRCQVQASWLATLWQTSFAQQSPLGCECSDFPDPIFLEKSVGKMCAVNRCSVYNFM